MINKKQLIGASILVLAILLRIIVFLRNRSLFLDEANLSRNILQKDYLDLFGSLDYQQFAPPLYLVTVKFITQIFGPHEYSLRLFSFSLGIASIFLFYKIVLKLFSNQSYYYPLLLFCFSLFMLRYQTENKQYASDVFFTLFFIYLGLKFNSITNYKIIIFGIVGAIAIWFSMPVVFILAGFGSAIFFQNYWIQKNNSSYLAYIIMISLWLMSFALLFYNNLSDSIHTSYLKEYHQNAYLKLPFSVSNIKQSYSILRDLLSSIVGPHLFVRIFVMFCLFFGTIKLIKSKKSIAILLLLPIIASFMASVFEYYILIPRLALFMAPIIILLIGLGFQEIYNYLSNFKTGKLKFVVFLLLIPIGFSLVGRSGLKYFVKEYKLEHARPVIQKLETSFSSNPYPIYVVHNGRPSFEFYTTLHKNAYTLEGAKIYYGDWSDNYDNLSETWKSNGIKNIWIYDSHTFGEEKIRLQDAIDKMGKIKNSFHDANTDCYLIELKH